MRPIKDITFEEASNLRYILMDIDDTLTREGKLPASSYSALWKLKEAGLLVIPVTGRPAGWCDLIARQWPADGVIGENGALAFWEEKAASGNPVLRAVFHPNAVKNDHPVLGRIKEKVLREIPGTRLSRDQFSRLYDIAFDFAEDDPVLPVSEAVRIKTIAEEEGAEAKISSIHVNVWMGKYDKLSMAEYFLSLRFGWVKGAGDREVIFIGDSPNDEPMFSRFPLCCGVANINKYKNLVKTFPAFVSRHECGEGFSEIAEVLLLRRGENERKK